MSDTEQPPVAPGIAAAMRNVRNAGVLTSPTHRRRWNLPSDREQPAEDPAADEHVK